MATRATGHPSSPQPWAPQVLMNKEPVLPSLPLRGTKELELLGTLRNPPPRV